ncbi:MAG: hypothetical protein AAGA81_20990 [Acidobacteriota bacterium]
MRGLSWWPPWRRRLDPSAFFNRLHCLSGFGDRITDVWAAVTLARLHAADARVDIYWHPDGNQYPGFTGIYDIDLFSIRGCQLVADVPRRSWSYGEGDWDFSDSHRIDHCLIQLPSGARQIVLRSGREWGNSCPDRLLTELPHYELDPQLTLEEIVETYRGVAADTVPSPDVVEGIPADIASRVGVHVRLTDKVLPDDQSEVAFEMSIATWKSIEASGLRYLEQAVERGEKFFICSDDLAYRDELIERVQALGGDAVCASVPAQHGDRAGYPALVDFFGLTRCARVVQMTKYSTFSIAAALSGELALRNFFDDKDGVGNRLDIWRSVLTDVTMEAFD